MISLYFTWEFAKKFRKTLPTQTIAELPGQLHGSSGSQNIQRSGPWHSVFKFSPLWSPYSLPKKKKKTKPITWNRINLANPKSQSSH